MEEATVITDHPAEDQEDHMVITGDLLIMVDQDVEADLQQDARGGGAAASAEKDTERFSE